MAEDTAASTDTGPDLGIPGLGPDPILISRSQVDTLYDLLRAVTDALQQLHVDYILTGGSLLGAVRQHSILFTDDDVDIAIVETSTDMSSLQLVRTRLPALLSADYRYTVAAWDGSDRVRHVRRSNVFLDVFCIRRYDTVDDLRRVVGFQHNGQAQPEAYVQAIVDQIDQAASVTVHTGGSVSSSLPLYPCWHFDRRKSIELWPREVYRHCELFPLVATYSMGPLLRCLCGPHWPLTCLYRAFGTDCLDVYYQSVSHIVAGTGAKQVPDTDTNTNTALPPHVRPGGTWHGGVPQPLQDEHYRPMQPLARVHRRHSTHCRAALHAYVARQTIYEQGPLQPAPPAVPAVRRQPTTVYMDGVFDLFHVGHVAAIQQCAALGTRVVIGVTGDADAAGYKRPPILSQDNRVAVVAALSHVDAVICPCPLIVTRDFIDAHGIDVVVHGFANAADAARQAEFFAVPMQLDKFRRIEYYRGLCTTDIIRKIQGLPRDTDSTVPAATQPSPWFGATLALATHHAPNIPYDPFPLDLRVAMEPHITKARSKRHGALQALCDELDRSESNIKDMVHASTRLASQGSFTFDTRLHLLRDTLLQCVGWSTDFDLAQLHVDDHGKRRLCQALTENYLDFQGVYDEYVRTVCAPQMAHDDESVLYYQSFPCLRIVQPGEFSIGPHADIAYGHHAGSINCYVPLTAVQGSAASLFVESRPGGEDWHPILTRSDTDGTVKHFAGALCLHWTTENTTNDTRVSLDFRLIAGTVFDSLAASDSVYRHGYYSCCQRRSGNVHAWDRVDPQLLPPDARVGFPWTVKEWDTYQSKKDKSQI